MGVFRFLKGRKKKGVGVRASVGLKNSLEKAERHELTFRRDCLGNNVVLRRGSLGVTEPGQFARTYEELFCFSLLARRPQKVLSEWSLSYHPTYSS